MLGTGGLVQSMHLMDPFKSHWQLFNVGMIWEIKPNPDYPLLCSPFFIVHTFKVFNGRLWDARWQTYQENFHCLRNSERAHMTEDADFTW